MRILIAEDDVALAGFVRKGLEAEHYAVDVSADGEQARALASELDYDLIILDLNLTSAGGSSNPQGRLEPEGGPANPCTHRPRANRRPGPMPRQWRRRLPR